MEKIISPCISICKTDPSTGYCYGCARTSEEKAIWKDENTTNEWKINNISELKNRLSGWQLSSFEESYDFKIKNGISNNIIGTIRDNKGDIDNKLEIGN